MQFTDLNFAFFLPTVFFVYHFSPQRLRLAVLLGSSIIFYASFMAPHLLLILTIVWGVTWIGGNKIANSSRMVAKRCWLWGAVTCNLAILILCKCWPSLMQLYAYWSFPLPEIFGIDFMTIGISYYTFQAISYLADVYLEIQKPEPHPGYFALYLCFFPKILQGPIEKAADLLPQLRAPYIFSYDNMRFGLVLFAWGLFKKVVVADRLATFVNGVYGNVQDFWGINFIVATWLYSIQIYCDFSGYTDMALGAASMFNVKLTQNFAHPYVARSIPEFWRRWHISLSRWLMDYIFKPLIFGLRDHVWIGTPLALIATFLICGLWHGASLGFLVWGALHAAYMVVAYIMTKARITFPSNRLFDFMKIIFTFNLVSFAWIFFRAETIQDAFYIVKMLPVNLFNDVSNFFQFGFSHSFKLGGNPVHLLHLYVIVLIVFGLLSVVMNDIPRLISSRFRWIIYMMLVTCIVVFKAAPTNFIYVGF